jgi:hypothetical protein
MQMEMFTKEVGKMTKLMGMEFMLIKMELVIKVIGVKTNNMEKVLRLGLMAHLTKELI